MANGEVVIDVSMRTAGAVKGARSVRQGIDDIKKADASLKWDGLEEGASAAKRAEGGFTVLKGAVATFAGNALTQAVGACKDLASQAVEIGSGFESSMSKVAALSGATGDELAALEAKAREMGATTNFTASQAADALGYMALAGWDASQSIEGLPGVLTLAQAGEMDLAAASDLVTDYLSAFNMTASDTTRMTDVLAYAQANANTTVEGLGMAFKNCAANCNAAGMDVETTSAAISMMANQGLKGSEAGTALTAVMRDMTSKMDDGAISIGDASVAVQDSQGNYRDFAAILADVEAATYGMGDAERASALMATFTADSIKGLNLMLNAGSDELVSFRDELYGSAGAAESAAGVMTDNLAGDVATMNSAFEELAIKVYQGLQEPLRDAVQFITSEAVPGLTALAENADRVVPAVVGIGTGFALVANKAKLLKGAATAHAALEKAVVAVNSTMTTYKRTVVAGEAAYYKLDKATGQYVRTSKTLKSAAASSTAAVKTQAVAMNAGSLAAKGMGAALKTIAPVAAMTLLVEVVSGIAGAMADAKEREENLAAATEGLAEATSAYGDAAGEAYGEASGGAEEYAGSLDDVVAANADCLSKQAELAGTIEDTWAEAGTSAGLVDRYTETIERLTSKYDENGDKAQLSAREQAELKAAVEGLNGVTEANYEITDLATGQLSESTDAIKKNSEAWKDNAKQQAAQKALEGIYEQQMEVKRQLGETNKALAESEEKVIFAIGGVPIVTEDNRFALQQLREDRAALEAQNAALAESEQFYIDQMGASVAPAQEASAATDGAAAAMEGNATATDGAAAALQGYIALSEEQMNAIYEVVDGSPALRSALDQNGWSVELLGQKLANAGIDAKDLAASVEDLASRTGNAFEKIEYAADLSLDSMIETLAYNTEATRNWSDNVAALYEKAGSDSERQFVQYIASMGVEYAPIVQQLLDDSSGKLSQLADQWGTATATGKDAALYQAGLMTDGITQEILDSALEANSAGRQLGGAIADGTEQGISEGTGKVDAAVATVASVIEGTFRGALGIHSPSTVMHALGLDVDAGIEGGISEGSSGASGAMGGVVGSILAAMSGLDAARATVSGIFGEVRDLISSAMGDAFGAVSGAIGKIKSAFDFSWSLPPLKLPRLTVTGGFSISPPSVPSFDIDWYARGGVFSRAQVIGVGEAGPEAVLPLTNSRAMEAVGASIAKAAGDAGSSRDTGITIVIEKFVHTGAEVDDEALLRRIAQKVKMRKRSGGFA